MCVLCIHMHVYNRCDMAHVCMYGYDALYNDAARCPEIHDQGQGQALIWAQKSDILQVRVSSPWDEGT